VDIYAPAGSDVVATESGEVLEVGCFTSAEQVPYWNTTYYVLTRHPAGRINKYAELGDVVVRIGETLEAGQVIGHVGSVLDADRITDQSPLYVQQLRQRGHQSMLHFEMYAEMPGEPEDYLGGNTFALVMPENLLDCTSSLEGLTQITSEVTR
jgi:murein DD-endopeptidase MepM/ murein hydrolase activator NlpD